MRLRAYLLLQLSTLLLVSPGMVRAASPVIDLPVGIDLPFRVRRVSSAQNIDNDPNPEIAISEWTGGRIFFYGFDENTNPEPKGFIQMAPGSIDQIELIDLNNDGVRDLLVFFENSTFFQVALNAGNGTFGPLITNNFAMSNATHQLADFNGDSAPEVLTRISSTELRIFENNGNGEFVAGLQIIENGATLSGPLPVDLDQDTDLDIAIIVRSSSPTLTQLAVLKNQGDGTFLSPAFITLPHEFIRGFVAADLNGDNAPELLLPNREQGTGLLILINDGNGDFPANATVPGFYSKVAVGLLNADDKPDLALRSSDDPLHSENPEISIVLNLGNLTFAEPVSYPTFLSDIQLEIIDIDADLDQDLVLDGDGYFSVQFNNGSGNFSEAIHRAQRASTHSSTHLDLADFDGDGDRDFIGVESENLFSGIHFTPSHLDVTRNDGTASFNDAAPAVPTHGTALGEIVDVDGMNGPDLLSIASNDGIAVNLNLGNGEFGPSSFYPIGESSSVLAVSDFDGLNGIDVSVLSAGSNSLSVLLNKGDGTYATATAYTTGTSPTDIAIGDFDGDGSPDVAVANNESRNVSVFFNNGAGLFGSATLYPVGRQPSGIVAGKIDNDDDLDLVTVNRADDNLSFLLNNGTGVFSPGANYPVADGSDTLIGGDWNGDGYTDLAVSNFFTDSTWILINDGQGGFPNPQIFSNFYSDRQKPADLDLDGDLDIFVRTSARNQRMLINDGSGFFVQRTLPIHTSIATFAIGDLDSDGDPDFATATGQRGIALLYNQQRNAVSKSWKIYR